MHFIKLRKKFTLLPCLLFCIYCNTSSAGMLDDFENDATQARETQSQEKKSTETSSTNNRSRSRSRSTHSNGKCSSLVNCIFSGIFEGIWGISKLGGEMSMERMNAFPNKKSIFPRATGDPLLPLARVDVYLHETSNNVSAKAIRAELGYGALAFQFRRTVYEEPNPQDQMTLTQLHALYRMSFGNHVVMNWGLGTFELSGNEKHKTLSMTFPIHVQVNSNWGWEVKPNYANFNGSTVWDVEGGLLFTKKHFSVDLGYRRLSSPEQIIHGPYVGASFFY